MLSAAVRVAAVAAVLVLAGCGLTGKSGAPVKSDGEQTISVGFMAGQPYQVEFAKGVQPLLEAQGYQVRIVEFTDGNQINFALASGDIDANVFQHISWLNGYNEKHQLNLEAILPVPTPPMGIYSSRHHSLDEAPEGMTVSIPNDPANVARALVLLERTGWIRLNPNYDPVKVSVRDIAENKKDIHFVSLDLAQLPRSREDVDYAVVSGNYAVAAGFSLSEALLLEETLADHLNQVVIRPEDSQKKYVQDLLDAYRSPAFKEVILTDPLFAGYALPEYVK
ncbi:MetQ/NlpA family ABC transporter substrate-binding protein [Brevibacillus marinus]|uniref:MetQ/NlpA family ABC transporter substrate-binding protein n=1 Tax=Brevibacillus marinus TaxID=2496837 RepID=UPI0013E080A3|nr:MetQ/NlpA family ABC transporter substrate-binding protein [Brevibacillus marinus]